MRSKTRWVLTRFMALATFAFLAAGPTVADAAPDVSPFAGSWSGTFTVTDSGDAEFFLAGTFQWTISDAGRITGTFFHTTEPVGGPFSFVGHVRADGDLMVIMRLEGGNFPHEGSAEIDRDGNLVASATDTFSPRAHTWSLLATRASD